MNTIDKDYRLDDIVEILKTAKFATMDDLMGKTGKSRATIKRDVRLLKKHFPQIRTRMGVGGGIFWEDNDE